MTVKFFVTGAAALLIFGATAPQHAAAQTTELKVSVFTPPVNPFSVEMERIGKEIFEKTQGKLKLNIFHASQLGPAPRQFDLVRTGVADMAVVFHGLTPGRFPLTALAELPGVSGQVTAPLASALLDMTDEYLAAEHPGVKVLNFATTPNLPLISRAEYRTLASLKGKRIRYPGPGHAITIAALGAVPVQVQPFELAESLSRGQIDGALTGTGGIISFKLQDTARFILTMQSGAITDAVVIAPAAYDRIPADLRKVFDQYFGPAGQPTWSKMIDRSEAADFDTLVKEGVKATTLNAEDQATFDKIAAQTQENAVAELEKKGLPARAYFAKLKEAIKKHSN